MGLIKNYLTSKDERDNFISINQAFELMKTLSPEATLPQIALAFGEAFGVFFSNRSIEDVAYNDITGKMLSEEDLRRRQLQNERDGYLPSRLIEQIWLNDINDLNSLPFPEEHNIIGWRKKDFYGALKKDGLDIEAILSEQRDVESQEERSMDTPVWFKPYLLIPYLTLPDAVETIIRLIHGFDSERHINRNSKEYYTIQEMLMNSVDAGLIKTRDIALAEHERDPLAGVDLYGLEPLEVEAIISEHELNTRWELDIKDIKKVCDKVGYYFPLTIDLQDGHGLVARDPEIRTRLTGLEAANKKLQAANKKLQAENEALKKQLDEAYNSNVERIEFLYITDYLKYTAKVQKDFYSKPDNRPKVDAVINDMIENYKLSKNDATAIERVARPR